MSLRYTKPMQDSAIRVSTLRCAIDKAISETITAYGEKLTYGEILQALNESSTGWSRYLIKSELEEQETEEKT